MSRIVEISTLCIAISFLFSFLAFSLSLGKKRVRSLSYAKLLLIAAIPVLALTLLALLIALVVPDNLWVSIVLSVVTSIGLPYAFLRSHGRDLSERISKARAIGAATAASIAITFMALPLADVMATMLGLTHFTAREMARP
jgi:hypothetical protein